MAPPVVLDPAALALAGRLVADPDRPAAARALARHLGGDDLIVFVPDARLAIPLPALGFPQTLPEGRRWQRFLRACRDEGHYADALPAPGGASVAACGVAAADGSVLVVLGVREHRPDLAALRAVLPLLAATFARERAMQALESSTALAREMAAQARALTGALDGARRDLQAALATAEAARQREAFLGNAAVVLDASLDYEETLRRVARLVAPGFADYCIVEVLEDDRSLRLVAAAHRDPRKDDLLREYRRRYPVARVRQATVATLFETREALLFPAITHEMMATIAVDDEHLAMMRDLAPTSCIIAPLVTRGHVIGLLSCVRAGGSAAYGEMDRQFAEQLAHRAALAIENARLYREAREALTVRDQFLSIAAHEMRTPVTSIKGYAQLLLRRQASRTLDAVQLARYVQVVAHAADRLDRLTYDLLDIARIRTGKLLFRFQTVDLARHLEAVVAEYRERSDDRHTFAIERWDDPCEVMADAERIEQVVVNLLENAVKYSPDGGIIALSLVREDAGARLSVRDEGIGLPVGAQETIFEPFTRAANAEERGLPGVGIGLNICRTIVERHGGRLWAESAGTDRGTRFIVWLPRTIDAQGAPAR